MALLNVFLFCHNNWLIRRSFLLLYKSPFPTGSSHLHSYSNSLYFILYRSTIMMEISNAPESSITSRQGHTEKDEKIPLPTSNGFNSTSSNTSEVQTENQAPSPPIIQPKKSFKFKLTVFMLCITSVIVAMDSVIVAATLPAITVALKGDSLEAFWVGTSYLLAQTVSITSYF